MTAEVDGEIGRNPVYIGSIATLCVIAVLLNLIVIYAVVKFGRYRASIDIFLTNLAASDILHAGIVTPVQLKKAAESHEDFYGNNLVCKLVMFVPLLSVMGAILTIVAIAIDRYRVIVEQKQLYRSGALTAIVVIWVTSILVSAPQLYEYNVYEDVDEYNLNLTYKSCGSEGIVEHFETIYASLVFVFAFFVPLIVLFVCYLKLVLYVWRHGKRFRKTQVRSNGESSTGAPQDQNKQTERMKKMLSSRMIKILKMLIWITATFIVLWTPYFIIFGMTEVMGTDDTSNFTEWPHVVCRTMTVLSTISNPVLYLAFSETFRDAVCKYMRRRPTLPLGNASSRALRSNNKVKPTSIGGVKAGQGSAQTEIQLVPLKLYTAAYGITPKNTQTPSQNIQLSAVSC